MRKFLAEISLRQKIRHDNLQARKKFMAWDKIERIALIISDKHNVNKSAIDKFIDETGKFVEVFYVQIRSKQATYHDWHCLLRKDSSILKLPNKALDKELKHRKYDVVINTSDERELFSNSMVSSLPASFKCGSSARFNDVDLVIKKTEPFNLLMYLDQIFKYLKMIRT